MKINGHREPRYVADRRKPALFVCLFLLFSAVAFVGNNGLGQDGVIAPTPIYQREPYDEITLKEDASGNGGTFRVRPLPFDRQPPEELPSTGTLEVEVWHDGEFHKAEVAWQKIAKVQVFQHLVLAEAERLVAANEFERAFDHYAFMLKRYPKWPTLAESINKYLYRNAGALFQQQRHAESLAVLDELSQRDRDYPGLGKAWGDVTGQLMKEYFAAEQYAAARRLLKKAEQRADAQLRGNVEAWRSQLKQASDEHLQRASAAFDSGQYRRAHAHAARAIEIWPTSASAHQTAQRIAARYPIVRVAVASSQSQRTAGQFDRVAARHRRLTSRPLVERSGWGGSGGLYSSRLGTWRVANDWRSLVFQLRRDSGEDAGALTGYDVARWLWQAASSERPAHAPWRQLAASVEVKDVYRVHVELRSPHLSPLGVLANLPAGTTDDAQHAWPGDYVRETDDGIVRFVHARAADVASVASRGPSEVVEIPSPDAQLALAALREGRVDVIERVPPSLLESLAGEEDVTVLPYAVPSIHVLVPNNNRPLPASSTFRRALAFAVDREAILRQQLLAGTEIDGALPISAPLPRSFAAGQPWGYAYDEDIAALPYAPRVGLTLARVAQADLAQIAARSGQPPPKLDELVLGHSDDWLHGQACTAIAAELNRIGLRCRVHSLTTGDAADLAECDFIYTEIVMADPMVDLPQWLAGHPLIRPSDHLALAIREAIAATNWRQASERWHRVHEVISAEQTVIPLWQLVDHLAVHSRVTGTGEEPVSLYQNVDSWRFAADGAKQE